MSERFKRTIEDFVCDVCNTVVKGNGYTNHCPHCLSSKHVDIHPGDRESMCRGTMEPIAIHTKNGKERVRHRCVICNHIHENRVATDDNRDRMIDISKNI